MPWAPAATHTSVTASRSGARPPRLFRSRAYLLMLTDSFAGMAALPIGSVARWVFGARYRPVIGCHGRGPTSVIGRRTREFQRVLAGRGGGRAPSSALAGARR